MYSPIAGLSTSAKILVGAIVLGLVAGYGLSQVAVVPSGSSVSVPIVYYFVQWNELVYSGWPYPIATSMIVVLPDSLGVIDVFFNALAIVWLDRLLSSAYSTRQYLSVFVATGIAGNLLSLLNGPNTISFGASGGIFGLIAGVVAYDYARSRVVNKGLLVWFVLVFVFSSAGGSVNIFAHLGGALAGLLCGYVIWVSSRGSQTDSL